MCRYALSVSALVLQEAEEAAAQRVSFGAIRATEGIESQ